MSNENNPNLTEMIREIHDGVAREMYNKAIDECLEILKFYRNDWDGIEWAIRRIEEIKNE